MNKGQMEKNGEILLFALTIAAVVLMIVYWL
jgi:hypothetical protein